MDAIEAIFNAAAAAPGQDRASDRDRPGSSTTQPWTVTPAPSPASPSTPTPDPVLVATSPPRSPPTTGDDEDETDVDVEVWAEPDDDPSPTPTRTGPEPMTGFRCSDIDGNPIDPTEATGYALLHSTSDGSCSAGTGGVGHGRGAGSFTGPSTPPSCSHPPRVAGQGATPASTLPSRITPLPWAHPDKGEPTPGTGHPRAGSTTGSGTTGSPSTATLTGPSTSTDPTTPRRRRWPGCRGPCRAP